MNDNWKTPDWLKGVFEGYFDPCPLNPSLDGLTIDWKDRSFVNPPYSCPEKWVDKAILEHDKGVKPIVLLLRVDTSTKWYFRLVNAKAHFITFCERLHFNDISGAANFPSMLVVLC